MKFLSPFLAACLFAGALVSAADAQAAGQPTKRPPTKTPTAKPVSSLPAPQIHGGTIASGSNDDCNNPKGIAGSGPFSFDNTLASTGAEGQSNGNCLFFGTTGIDNDVWFVWTAGFTGSAVLEMCSGASHDSKVAVYSGAGCPGGAALACDDDFCCLACPSRVVFSCTQGNDYTIQLGNYPSAAGGTGTFSINQFFPPAGDDCASPNFIANAGPHGFDTSNATTGTEGQNNSNCFFFGTSGIDNDVWYAWTSGFTGPAQVTLCAFSSHDSKVAVYDGAVCPTNQALGCDDDFCFFAGPSRALFSAVQGDTYMIQVGNYPGAAGSAGSFTVDPYTPPAGDLCTAPIAISGDGPHPFDNTGMSQGSEGQNNSNCLFFGTTGIDKDMWFTWQAPCSGTVTVSLCAGASHDSKLAVYDGAVCPSAQALACDDDLCSFAGPSEVQFSAVNGNTYLIQLGDYPGAGGGAGTFSLSGCTGTGDPGTGICFGDGTSATRLPVRQHRPARPRLRQLGRDRRRGAPAQRHDEPGHGRADLERRAAEPLSIFLQGDASITRASSSATACAASGGNLKRLYVKNAVGGVGDRARRPATRRSRRSRRTWAIRSLRAATRWYQAYYRDPDLAFCPPAGQHVERKQRLRDHLALMPAT